MLSIFNNCSGYKGINPIADVTDDGVVDIQGSEECGYRGDWNGTDLRVNGSGVSSNAQVNPGDQVQFVTHLYNIGTVAWTSGRFNLNCTARAQIPYQSFNIYSDPTPVSSVGVGGRHSVDIRFTVPAEAAGYPIIISCRAESGGFCNGEFTYLSIEGGSPNETLNVRSPSNNSCGDRGHGTEWEEQTGSSNSQVACVAPQTGMRTRTVVTYTRYRCNNGSVNSISSRQTESFDNSTCSNPPASCGNRAHGATWEEQTDSSNSQVACVSPQTGTRTRTVVTYTTYQCNNGSVSTVSSRQTESFDNSTCINPAVDCGSRVHGEVWEQQTNSSNSEVACVAPQTGTRIRTVVTYTTYQCNNGNVSAIDSRQTESFNNSTCVDPVAGCGDHNHGDVWEDLTGTSNSQVACVAPLTGNRTRTITTYTTFVCNNGSANTQSTRQTETFDNSTCTGGGAAVCNDEGSWNASKPGYSSYNICRIAYSYSVQCIANPNGNGCWIPQTDGGGGSNCRVDGSYSLPNDTGYTTEGVCRAAMGYEYACEQRNDGCWHPYE